MFTLQTYCPILKSCLEDVKKLVTYFKRSGLNNLLSKTLKQDVPTRWNSQLLMLESYLENAEKVRSILKDKNESHRGSRISDGAIQDLVELLKPFKECSEELSATKSPTIQLVVPWFHNLREHLLPRSMDSAELKELRSQALLCFDEYCVPRDIHYAACFLQPQ